MVDIVGRAVLKVQSQLDTNSLTSDGKKAGTIFAKGALIGVAALGSLAAYSVKAGLAAEDAAKKQRIFAGVLKNMGKEGAADRLADLASSLQRISGIDDEVIKGGQTVLASFKSIAATANTVGGTFDRATKASVNLSATPFFNGNVEAAAKALGKALNDPTKGITALTRAGVPFSASQKEQIANFLKANDLASAQDIILGEVETKFGGLAESAATGSERFKSALGELQESFGFLLSDLFGQEGKKSFIDQAADGIFKLQGKVDAFEKSGTWSELKSSMRDFGGDLKTVAGGLGDIIGYLDDMSKALTGSGLLKWLGQVGSALNPIQTLVGLLADLTKLIKNLPKLPSWAGGPSGLGKSGGGGSFAEGGRVMSGGLSLVGERGPELVNLPTGAYVHTNQQSRRIVAESGGSSFTYAPVFNGPTTGSDMLSDMEWSARFYSRQRVGSR